MPSTVASLLKAAGLKRDTVAPWAQRIDLPSPASTVPSTGIYIVVLTPQLSRVDGTLPKAPIACRAIDVPLDRREDLRLDGARPTAAQLGRRLSRFWLPDETVLYVGLADVRRNRAGRELRERAYDYARTRLGGSSPHAGGWPLLTLNCLPNLHIHYAFCDHDHVVDAEQACLRRFAQRVSNAGRAGMFDQKRMMPFANLEHPSGTFKRHGLTNPEAQFRPAARFRGECAGAARSRFNG